MRNLQKLLQAAVIGILLAVSQSALCAPVDEPWSEIEARTKFLRTKHYIEVVRVHSDSYTSASAKGGVQVPGPFPVHIVLPEDYETNVNRRYGVVYLLGGKSGWDNGPELGGATYWSVWCKTPLAMDHLKNGKLTEGDFQGNITPEELDMFNQWLAVEPYNELIVVSLWNPGGGNTARYEKYLLEEVIPYVDAHYRTVPDRKFRGIDGACAGAAQAIMISARRPDIFGYAGGQQTDLGSYPMVPDVFRSNLARIRKAGGIAYNINTNVKDGCNSYSNRGRLYGLVQDMQAAGFPVDVHVFKSCPHGYCAYRYPNGHQALYWFSSHFKKNFIAMGMNQDALAQSPAPPQRHAQTEGTPGESAPKNAGETSKRLPGLW